MIRLLLYVIGGVLYTLGAIVGAEWFADFSYENRISLLTFACAALLWTYRR